MIGGLTIEPLLLEDILEHKNAIYYHHCPRSFIVSYKGRPYEEEALLFYVINDLHIAGYLREEHGILRRPFDLLNVPIVELIDSAHVVIGVVHADRR